MFNLNQIPRKNGVPILKSADLEVIADQEIQKFMKQQDLGPVEIDIEQFAEEYLHLRFDYAELSNNGSILGIMNTTGARSLGRKLVDE